MRHCACKLQPNERAPTHPYLLTGCLSLSLSPALADEYVRPACTELTFFQSATIQGHNNRMPNGLQMCADPTTEAGRRLLRSRSGRCGQRPRRLQIHQRGHVIRKGGGALRGAHGWLHGGLRRRWSVAGCHGSGDSSIAADERSWLNMTSVTSCALKAQILSSGQVTLIHETSTDQSLTQDSGNIFRVRWERGAFPNVDEQTCHSGCSAVGDACVCETQVETAAVFTDMGHLPSVEQVEALLTIGSAPPDAFANGTYAVCGTSACAEARAAGVTRSSFTRRAAAPSTSARSSSSIATALAQPTLPTRPPSCVSATAPSRSATHPSSTHSPARRSVTPSTRPTR